MIFTKETARLAGLKSAESRRSSPLKAIPEGFKIVPSSYPEHVPTSDEYPDLVLARTRVQLDLVGKQITDMLTANGKLDSRKLRDLTDAQTRLAEQERILAGRPLPGSRKPAPERPTKRQLTPTPQPVVEQSSPVHDPNEPNG